MYSTSVLPVSTTTTTSTQTPSSSSSSSSALHFPLPAITSSSSQATTPLPPLSTSTHPERVIHYLINGPSDRNFPLLSGDATIRWITPAELKNASCRQKIRWAAENKGARELFIASLLKIFPDIYEDVRGTYLEHQSLAKQEMRQLPPDAPPPRRAPRAPETNVKKLVELIDQLGIQPKDVETPNLIQYFHASKGPYVYCPEGTIDYFEWGSARHLDHDKASDQNSIAQNLFVAALKVLKGEEGISTIENYTFKSKKFGIFDMYAMAKALSLEITQLGSWGAPFTEYPILAEDGSSIKWITTQQVTEASPEQQKKWATANTNVLRILKEELENTFKEKGTAIKEHLREIHDKRPYFKLAHMVTVIQKLEEFGIEMVYAPSLNTQTASSSNPTEPNTRKRQRFLIED